MRKALVGIAAALMLTTLVIAIVPASGGGTLPPTVYFIAGSSTVGGFELSVSTSGSGEFSLWQTIIFSNQYVATATFTLCHGLGATFKGAYLTIHGTCDVQSGFAGAVISASGMVTGFIVLTLTFSGKPPTSMMLFMKPETTPTWPPPPSP
jgi:hypothetical protein